MKKINLIIYFITIVIIAIVSVACVQISKEFAKNHSLVKDKETALVSGEGVGGLVQAKTGKVEEQTNKGVIETEGTVVKTTNAKELHICDRSPEQNFSSMLCYIVKPGDTLWNIAERYLGTGFRWSELHNGPPRNGEYEWDQKTDELKYVGYSRLKDPATQLLPGMIVGMSPMLPLDLDKATGCYFVETSELSPFNEDILLVVNTCDSNQKLIYLNGKRFDKRTYRDVSHINFSDGGARISYIAKNSPDKCEILVNLTAYEFMCGNDIQDPIFSPNGEHFAFRTNLHNQVNWTGSDSFYIVSDIGNGIYYDYVDSLMWLDNKTIVYRARKDDTWRIVINNKDQDAYKYVDFLAIENGFVQFSAEHEDGSWTNERVVVN